MVIFSSRAENALKALACMPGKNKGQWVRASEISKACGVPLPYLHKILNELRRAGLTCAKRGYLGGVSLARPAAEISLMDVISVIDGENWKRRCLLSNTPCAESHRCAMHEFWERQRRDLAEELAGMTLDIYAGRELAHT